MIPRISIVSDELSFFLFGPRGVGKSTFLEFIFKNKRVLAIDLLNPTTYKRYSLNPQLILSDWLVKKEEWIFIDEIQKIPGILDVVQEQMRKRPEIKFALTGSSARKLRRGASNLLGGRALEFHMHPLTHLEIGPINLLQVLSYGSLPHVFLTQNKANKVRLLHAYISTYLKEEVLVEQLIRKVEPFQRFLEVAAQMNGKIVNYAKIARDSGIEEKSVARYFQILEDTLVGFHLYPFNQSLRKQQSQKAKFYFFDIGVTRTLQNKITLELQEKTTEYGDLFEQFIFLECIRLNDYLETHFKFSYFRSSDNLEIDLIVERPGKSTAVIEIKSKDYFDGDDAKSLQKMKAHFENADFYVFNNCPTPTLHQEIKFVHWEVGMKLIFN